MGEFIVSARKYRPATFASVVGQDAITTTLKNAVMQEQVAQAFLFCGPRGVGKTTCARILAKTINCTHRTPEGEACNECESCRSFNESASFNIFELDAASNNSVEDIRNLSDQVRIPPQGAKYKVYIIDEVHMLSTAAFNAFLKTLEEPPRYAKFILATTEKHKILPTILSRCQVFDFKRIQMEDIVRHLMFVAQQEGIQYEEDALRTIAQKADGGLRDALSIFDQEVIYTSGDMTYQKVIENLNVLDIDYYIRMTDYLHKGEVYQALLTYNDIIEKGFDGQHFLDGICNHLRNLMVCRSPETIRLLDVGESIRARYMEQVKTLDAGFLLNSLDIFNRCNGSYKTSNNKRLHVEVALMMITKKSAIPSGVAPQAAPPQASPQPVGNDRPQRPAADKENAAPTAGKTQAADIGNTAPKREANAAAAPASHVSVKNATTSIRNLVKSIQENKPVQVAEENVKTETLPEKENVHFMDEEQAARHLSEQWERLMQQHFCQSPIVLSLISDKEYIHISGHSITFTVANEMAIETIRTALPEIQSILTTETGMHYEFAFQTDESLSRSVRIINPEEKFQKMSEICPEIKRLKSSLNLSIS